MTRHYKKLLSSLRDKLETKWEEAGDDCQDDLICAFLFVNVDLVIIK